MDMKNLLKNKFVINVILFFSLIFTAQDEEIEEVVVISSKVPVPLSEVIGSVALISGEDMEDRIVADLSDVLDKTVGVSVNTDNAYGRYFNDGVSIRGLGGTRVNIFIDGIRVSDAYTGYGRDVVDTELLKKVEILKGPSSALYGSDGLAGAVSYITKDPFDLAEDGSYFSGNYAYHGDSEHSKLALLAAFATDGFGTYLQITERERSEVSLHDDFETSEPNPLAAEGQSVIGKIKYQFSDSTNATFTYDSQEWSGDWTINTDVGTSGAYFPKIITTTSSLGDDEGSRVRVGLSIDFESTVGFYDLGDFKVYSQSTDQQQITNAQRMVMTVSNQGPPAPPMPMALFRDFQFNQSIWGYSLDLTKKLTLASGSVHNIVYGYSNEIIETQRYRNSTETNLMTGSVSTLVDGQLYPGKTFPDTDTLRSGLYVSDRFDLSDNTTVVLGIRHDRHELNPRVDALYENTAVSTTVAEINDGETSYKLGVLQDLGESISAFVQYAEGFRSPDYESANLSFTNFARNYAIVTNPNLESETSKGYEIGLRGSFDRTKISLSYYDNEYEDFIDSAFVGFSRTGQMLFQYQNLDNVLIDGFEVTAESEISDNLNISLGYNSSSGEKNDGNLTSIEPAETIIGASWNTDNEKLNVKLFATLTDESTTDLPATCGRSGAACLTLPSVTVVDIFSSYDVNPNISLRVALRNITDEKYWKWGSVNGLAENDSGLDLLSEPGMNLSASVKVSF